MYSKIYKKTKNYSELEIIAFVTGKSFSEHTARNELLCQLLGGHRLQWISHKMNIRHPGQLKKSKSWGPFWRAAS